jgi:hypothetical protein
MHITVVIFTICECRVASVGKLCQLCSLEISGGNFFPSIDDGWEFHVYYLPIERALQRTGHKLKW